MPFKLYSLLLTSIFVFLWGHLLAFVLQAWSHPFQTPPLSRSNGTWSKITLWRQYCEDPLKQSSQSIEMRNLSILENWFLPPCLNQVNSSPETWMSINSKSLIKLLNSSIAHVDVRDPDRSLGNRITLKSPPKHLGTSHRNLTPFNSSHNLCQIASTHGPYTPKKTQVLSFSTGLNGQETEKAPISESNLVTTLLSHIIRIRLAVLTAPQKIPIKPSPSPYAIHHPKINLPQHWKWA